MLGGALAKARGIPSLTTRGQILLSNAELKQLRTNGDPDELAVWKALFDARIEVACTDALAVLYLQVDQVDALDPTERQALSPHRELNK